MVMGIVLMALGAAAAFPGDASDTVSGSDCPRLELRATGQTDPPAQASGNEGSGPIFSAATAGDLHVLLSFAPRLSGRRAVLKVYTPKGHLYQELSVTLDASGSGGGPVSARLPISGTLIVNSSLYGRWSLATHLDGGTEACGLPSPFTITP